MNLFINLKTLNDFTFSRNVSKKYHKNTGVIQELHHSCLSTTNNKDFLRAINLGWLSETSSEVTEIELYPWPTVSFADFKRHLFGEKLLCFYYWKSHQSHIPKLNFLQKVRLICVKILSVPIDQSYILDMPMEEAWRTIHAPKLHYDGNILNIHG